MLCLFEKVDKSPHKIAYLTEESTLQSAGNPLGVVRGGFPSCSLPRIGRGVSQSVLDAIASCVELYFDAIPPTWPNTAFRKLFSQ